MPYHSVRIHDGSACNLAFAAYSEGGGFESCGMGIVMPALTASQVSTFELHHSFVLHTASFLLSSCAESKCTLCCGFHYSNAMFAAVVTWPAVCIWTEHELQHTIVCLFAESAHFQKRELEEVELLFSFLFSFFFLLNGHLLRACLFALFGDSDSHCSAVCFFLYKYICIFFLFSSFHSFHYTCGTTTHQVWLAASACSVDIRSMCFSIRVSATRLLMVCHEIIYFLPCIFF